MVRVRRAQRFDTIMTDIYGQRYGTTGFIHLIYFEFALTLSTVYMQ